MLRILLTVDAEHLNDPSTVLWIVGFPFTKRDLIFGTPKIFFIFGYIFVKKKFHLKPGFTFFLVWLTMLPTKALDIETWLSQWFIITKYESYFVLGKYRITIFPSTSCWKTPFCMQSKNSVAEWELILSKIY